MTEPTLESLAARIAALANSSASLSGTIPPSRDWRSVIGLMPRTEFSDLLEAEILAQSEAERRAALEQVPGLRFENWIGGD